MDVRVIQVGNLFCVTINGTIIDDGMYVYEQNARYCAHCILVNALKAVQS